MATPLQIPSIRTSYHKDDLLDQSLSPTSAALSPRRKLSVLDVANSPMAVNFHTWRINALTNNVLRQVSFLEKFKAEFAKDTRAVNEALQVLKDLGLGHADDNSVSDGLFRLMRTPQSALSDSDWLVAVKTYLSSSPELFEDFKDAFGVREENEDSFFEPDATAAATAAEDDDQIQAPLSRKSSKVKFDAPTSGSDSENMHQYFPPTPAPLEKDTSPFEMPVSSEPPTESPEVCLTGHYIPYDLHVALFDRPAEMQLLMSRNAEIFDNIRHACCHSDQDWAELESIFSAPREEMDDLAWMKNISKKMESSPHLLAVLKELVGYDMYEEVREEDIESEEEQEVSENVEWLDLVVRMRENEEIMSRLENDYPQFFANVKRAFDGDLHQFEEEEAKIASSEYNQFIATFFSARQAVDDTTWKSEIHRYLSRSSQLLSQLREIATYELDIDESNFAPAERPQKMARQQVAEKVPQPVFAETSRIQVNLRTESSNLRTLETSHPLFFNLLRSHLSPLQYARFLSLLYTPRTVIPDAQWTALITARFLSSSLRLRQMFRQVVGAVVAETGEIMGDHNEEYSGIVKIENRGKQLVDKAERHEAVFAKIHKTLKEDAYRKLTLALALDKEQVSDDEWVQRCEELLGSNYDMVQAFERTIGLHHVKKGSEPSETHTRPSAPSPTPSSPAPTPRTTIPTLLPSLLFFLQVKQAIPDTSTFGKLVHALIDRVEAEKIAARDEGGEKENDDVGRMKEVLPEVVSDTLGEGNEVGTKVLAVVSA